MTATAPALTYTPVPIGELCEFLNGGTPSKANVDYWDGEIPWITSAEINDGEVAPPRFKITQDAIDDSSTRLVPAGTLLLVIRTGVGKVGIAPYDLTFNQDINAILPDPKRLDKQYLRRFLDSQGDHFDKFSRGATVKGITREHLGRLAIPIPFPDDPRRSLAEQKRIAAILDKADAIRRRRQEAARLAATLIPSVFYEMFGDPVTNPKGWDKLPLVQVCESEDDIKCGPFGTQLHKEEFMHEGVPLWGIKHVNAGFAVPTDEFLHPDKAHELVQYSIEPGDIVMTRKGTIGNCAVYPQGWAFGIMHSDLLRLRVDSSRCLPVYLSHQLHHSPDVEVQLARISGGAIMQGVNVGKLKSLRVLVPPMSEQQKFAKAVEQFDALSSDQCASIKTMDDLFNSLVQRAFRGEL
jgi:type I restriction enzyme S subunit